MAQRVQMSMELVVHSFASQGQKPVLSSNRSHTNIEVQYDIFLLH